MEKIKKFLENQKENLKIQGVAFGLALGLVIFVILFADVFYREKTVVKRGFEIAVATDGKPVVKKEEKIG